MCPPLLCTEKNRACIGVSYRLELRNRSTGVARAYYPWPVLQGNRVEMGSALTNYIRKADGTC